MSTIVSIIVTALSLGGMFGLSALGLSLMYRITRTIQIAYGSVIMIVGLMLWSLDRIGLSPFASPFVGVILGMLLTLIIYILAIKPMFKRGHLMVIVALLGVDVMFFGIALVVWGPIEKFIPPQIPGEFFIYGAVVGYQKLVLFITVIICTAAIFAFFKYALMGKAMLAAADNREGAVAVGVDQSRMILIAVLVSGGIAGLAAGLMVSIIPVHPNFGNAIVLTIVIAMVLGGMGNLPGAFVGGIVLGALQGISIVYAPAWADVVQFAVLLAAMAARGLDFRAIRKRLGLVPAGRAP